MTKMPKIVKKGDNLQQGMDSYQGWAKTQNLEKTQKTRVFSRFLGFSLGFFKFGFFQDLH